MKAPLSLQHKIQQRKEDGSFRSLLLQDGAIDFWSNDYLGIARLNFDSENADRYGSTGSRLISGNHTEFISTEKELASFFKGEEALIFNSGYDANLGIWSSIPQKEDTILFDELSHASIRDGIRLSLAKSYKFHHNDLNSLEQKLKLSSGNIFIAIESIYSMDGDEAPLQEICQLAKKYGAFLIVDEAHSAGIRGEAGAGMVSSLNLDEEVFIKLITFGKAFGSHGAAVISDELTKNYLINFARSFIYTTALSIPEVLRIKKVLKNLPEMRQEREKLQHNIQYFKNSIETKNIDCINSNSAIQSIVISGNEHVKELAAKIQKEGMAVKAILSPTVPKGKERIRLCLHSYNTIQEIDKLIACLR